MTRKWTRKWQITWLLAAFSLSFGLLTSCHHGAQNCDDGGSGTNPVDPPLLAFLSRARSAHHLADLNESSDPAAAVQALSSIVEGPAPVREGTPLAEVREVMADTQARIAELESRLLHFENASKRIDAALLEVPETSYFRGRLFEVRGIVEQRLAEEYSKSGRTSDAAAARSRALVAFEHAMQIQADVIRQTPPAPPSNSGTTR